MGCYAVILVLTVILAFTAGASAEQVQHRNPQSQKIHPRELIVGHLNTLKGVNIKDARVAMEMYFNRASHDYPTYTVKFEMLTDVASTAQMIRQGRLHFIGLSGADYLDLRDLYPVVPLFVSSQVNEPVEPYVLVVRKGMTLEKMAQLRQRRLRVEHIAGRRIDLMWLDVLLDEHALPAKDSFFTSIQETEKPIRIILPVFFGQAEACLVSQSAFDTMIELNPQVGRKLTVLKRSPGFIKSVTCVADYIDDALADKVVGAAMDLRRVEYGRQLMLIFKTKRNFLFNRDFLAETERLLLRYATALKTGE